MKGKNMKKIGLLFSEKAEKTSRMAKKIREAYGMKDVELVPLDKPWESDLEIYDNLIIGVSTWFDGELPVYWDELIPAVESLDLKGKKVAIFGLGDQVNYPDNFVDGMGILGEAFERAGAKLVGFTSPEGYNYSQSRALRNGKLCGLALDLENQPELTDKRIEEWCKQLKREF